ncbi:hypothetical protein HA402_013505 [Bradysia odoriphaga]|nr:hypothetical protein HA402_013505 [Bradysia odoriphaga]
MQPIPAVSPFYLSLRGEGSVNILVKGQGPINISIDAHSADSSIDQSDDENETKSLMELFYDNMNGDDDIRPLSAAAERCAPKVAEMLIKNGADLNIVGGGGWRPIHVATYTNCKEIVKMLLERGADFDAKIDLGYSAVRIALKLDPRESSSEADSWGNTTEEVSLESATEENSSDDELEEYPSIDESTTGIEMVDRSDDEWYSDKSEKEWYKSMTYEVSKEMVEGFSENQANKESEEMRGDASDVKLNLLE